MVGVQTSVRQASAKPCDLKKRCGGHCRACGVAGEGDEADDREVIQQEAAMAREAAMAAAEAEEAVAAEEAATAAAEEVGA